MEREEAKATSNPETYPGIYAGLISELIPCLGLAVDMEEAPTLIDPHPQ